MSQINVLNRMPVDAKPVDCRTHDPFFTIQIGPDYVQPANC